MNQTSQEAPSTVPIRNGNFSYEEYCKELGLNAEDCRRADVVSALVKFLKGPSDE